MAKLYKKLIAVLQRVFYKQKLYHILNKDGLYRPRVITHIDGGLGSQMWQFALGYSVSQKVGLPPRVDFYLMSQCKHAIISNSGFSWMAAWLNNNKSARIIMPDRWNNDKSRMESSKNAFYVQGWIKMPVDYCSSDALINREKTQHTQYKCTA